MRLSSIAILTAAAVVDAKLHRFGHEGRSKSPHRDTRFLYFNIIEDEP